MIHGKSILVECLLISSLPGFLRTYFRTLFELQGSATSINMMLRADPGNKLDIKRWEHGILLT